MSHLSKHVLRGNDTRIDPKKPIIPRFITNNLVAKEEQQGNQVPLPPVENSILAKAEVDANHK